jgi:hypothetical protein
MGQKFVLIKNILYLCKKLQVGTKHFLPTKQMPKGAVKSILSKQKLENL